MVPSLGSVPQKSSDVVFRRIQNECILVPIVSSSEEVDSIYNLNDVGASVWDKIDGSRTVRDIAEELQAEYDAGEEEITRDVLALTVALAERGLIELR